MSALGSRWLGAGLASVVAVITLVLAVTDRLTRSVAPETAWMAGAAAVVTLVVVIWTCAVPLDAERERGGGRRDARLRLVAIGSVFAGIVASAVVLASLVLPAASLSAGLAVQRAGTDAALSGEADPVGLGIAGTATFGVAEWAGVFAASARPQSYDGSAVTLTGFVTPAAGDSIGLTRMVVTHCIIDAQPVSVPVIAPSDAGYATGDWIEVTGTVRADADGALRIEAAEVKRVDEPEDPYER